MKFWLALLLLVPRVATAEWVNISDPVTTPFPKPGNFGPAAGITVDRVSGEVFMVAADYGIWKSSDRGRTFARADDKTIGGRCETGWALQLDPGGRRLFCFMIYGSSALTTDSGQTWHKSKVSHLDFGAADWADTGRRLLALRHESGGLLTTSEDAGATWTDLEKGFTGCGVFARHTFVATKAKQKGIFRSIDAGKTWTQVFADTPAAAVPVVFQGKGYWATGKGLLVSTDQGASWVPLNSPTDASFGPYFGKDETRFVVVGKSGFHATLDGGKTWQMAAPLPAGFGVGRVGPNYAWDPNADLFYASSMGKPAFKWQR